MKQLYYILNESIKSYHVFRISNPARAAELLKRINECRLQIALLAEQRQIFIEQLDVEATSSGYKQDRFFTHDDINSVVSRMIAYLNDDVKISLVQEGTRESLFTRNPVSWQHLMSAVQWTPTNGQQIPFDFTQEIYLEKSQTLNIGVINQTSDTGYVFVHGANLADDLPTSEAALRAEINELDGHGKPRLPELQIVPIQFQFESATADTKATAVDGGKDIYSLKVDRSVILTHVSTTSILSRISLIDKGRDQLICNEVESLGIAGTHTDKYTCYYPLPYPHILRAQDRLQLLGLNGSDITGTTEDANALQTIAFKGFTV